MTPLYPVKEQQASLFPDTSQNQKLTTPPTTLSWSSFQLIVAIISISCLGGIFLGLFYSLFTSLLYGLLIGLIHGFSAGIIWSFIWYQKWS